MALAAGQEVDVSTMLSSFPLSLAGMRESHGTSSEEVRASTYSDKPVSVGGTSDVTAGNSKSSVPTNWSLKIGIQEAKMFQTLYYLRPTS